ncbi:protein pxr1-like [Nicotiana tomentosiformis]|uniref:protein pxr1-like n=1 Tax=Nicotiana tomentosiformis TaxID=4098 RepID=UPI00388C84F5
MVSSETEQVTSRPKATPQIISEVATNLETRFVLVGTVAGVETTKSGKVDGKNEKRKEKESEGKNAQELVPSEQETLGDLLKMMIDSYNYKKKRSSGVKVPGTARANKKRNDVSYILVEIPPARGRATRSQKKQSEAELEKALEERKRKADAKGKKKVIEHVEAVEIDEIDLVLQDEEETEEMEVVTQKAKKVKTSSKRFVSKTKYVEPSTLAKRTRPALKPRKVKIVEERNVVEKKKNLMLRRTGWSSLGREPS